MEYVNLGASNLRVSEFCLGTMMFGQRTDADESTRITRRAFDAGVTFFDTADVYNEGRSEEIVGAAIQGIRDEIVLASKVGMAMGSGQNQKGISRYHIMRGVEASLRRLKTDRLDLLYVHWPMKRMNLDEMMRALDDLVRQGKVLYLGCSNFAAWLMVRAMWIADGMGCPPFVAGQYPYNLIERGVDVELLPAAEALGVGITVYRPLAGGTLTAKYLGQVPDDSRGKTDERYTNWSARYPESIASLKAFAEERGYSAADAAIAWVRSHHAITAPIVGISRLEQLDANLRGFEWQMSQEEREALSAFIPTEVKEETGGMFPTWRRAFGTTI